MISVNLFFIDCKHFLVFELPVLRNGRIIRLDKVEIHPSERQIWHYYKKFIFPMTKSLTDKGTVSSMRFFLSIGSASAPDQSNLVLSIMVNIYNPC
jgi:hypothetical protein